MKQLTLSDAVAVEIRAEMARQGMRSVADMAKRIGMSRNALGKRVRGEYPITLEELNAIATVLGLSPVSLLRAASVDTI